MDAKLRYKAKKVKIVFFDIDDTLYRQIDLLQPACEEAMGGKKLPDPELFYQIFGKKESEQGLQPVEGFLGLFLKSWT